MGVSTGDLYGEGGAAQPATPGTYGQAPAGAALPAGTRLGAVRLAVAEVDRSRRYYEQVLGLRALPAVGDAVPLAAHGEDAPLVELVETPGAQRADGRPHWGLYHFAILVPDRAALGRFVRHVSDLGVRVGAADHLVSEAFYLTDPDGLGIEVYADRPRDTWQRLGRELMLATDPVDVPDLLRAAGETPWEGMPPGTVMGHVHLHVGDVATAGVYYGDTLGFDRTTCRYPGALFLGAGGYHHHVGANTWAGPSATAPRADEARLLSWTMEVPTARDVETIVERLIAAGHRPAPADGDAVEVADPWGTTLRVRSSR
jgi:catechol 2,3-dioxygenase